MALLTGPIIFLTRGERASIAAFPQARAFAEALGRDIRLVLRVPRTAQDVLLPKYAEQLRAALPDAAQSLPVDVARPADVRRIVRELAAGEGGIVAMAPGRKGGIGRLLRPNDDERLLLDGLLPVLTIPRSSDAPIRRVLFPVDLAPRSEQLFDEAVALCARLGAELHLLHVFGPDRLLPSEVDTARRAAAQTPRDLYDIDREHVQSLADRATAAGVVAVAGRAEGRAHQQILAYTRTSPIDLVIMATHGPRNTSDILFGTTTASVMRKATVPVLAAFT